MLTGALRTGDLVLHEHIHPLAAEDRVAIRRCQRECHVFIDPQSVAAIMGFPVNNVSGYTECCRWFFYQRNIISACTASSRDCWGYFMGPGVSGIYAMIFIHHGDIPSTHAHGSRKRWRYAICSYPCMFLIGFQDQRLMAVHLSPKCSGDILCAVHNLPALIVQAHDAGTFLHCLQRWGAFFLITDPPGALGRLRTEPRREHTGIPLTSLTPSGRKGCMHILCQNTVPISLGYTAVGDKGLLLHTRLGTQRTAYSVQIPYLIPLVGSECHCFAQSGLVITFPESSLNFKGNPQLLRQRLSPFGRTA